MISDKDNETILREENIAKLDPINGTIDNYYDASLSYSDDYMEFMLNNCLICATIFRLKYDIILAYCTLHDCFYPAEV